MNKKPEDVSFLHAVFDVIITLFLFFASGIMMSMLLFTAVITDALLHLIQTYTLRPYQYLHFKLGLLRRAK